MKVYLDLGALLSLLIHGDDTPAVRDTLRGLEGPFRVNLVHVLQIESSLFRSLFQRGEAQIARDALLKWRHLWTELVLEMDDADYGGALLKARLWNARSELQPPRWGFLLHPALARQTGATHFLSLHPGNRRLARAAGLAVIPAR